MIKADPYIAISGLVAETIGSGFTDLVIEPESAAYFGCQLRIGALLVKFRSARITPTKNGQFVTLWKRNALGVTEPLDCQDPFDYCLIAVANGAERGLFVLPKSILAEHKIVTDTVPGKRGFRVYPPWDTPQSRQAATTQKWQLKHFIAAGNDPASLYKELNPLRSSDQ